MTESTFAQAAAEYRANNQKPRTHREKSERAMSAVERETLRAEIFDTIYDSNRASLAALVAFGAEDIGLTRQQLGMLFEDMKIIARLWDKLEAGGAA